MKKGIMAARALEARQSILGSAEALGARFDVAVPELPTAKDPQVQALFELETVATFLEELVDAVAFEDEVFEDAADQDEEAE